MSKTFYLFRHGETDCNVQKRWQGCSIDSLLNKNGLQQAKELAYKLQNLGIEKIYSSGLKRALQTSSIVAASLNSPLEIISDLREGNLGKAEGLLYNEVEAAFPQIVKAWYAEENDMNLCFPQGETKLQMQQRMFAVFERLLAEPESIVGICSHGSSIRYLLMKFGVMPHRMPNTALYKIVYQNSVWQAEKLF